MERKLLIISKYPEIIQEFLAAMEGKELVIDTALNGIEAAAKLKRNHYQIVITGISLEGYNGEQIITYLNKNSPNTVCIIYTTAISPSQLHFFINERNVFRVFLRPVDMQKVFYAALEDAFEYYDVRVADQRDESSRDEAMKEKREECRILHEKLIRQKKAMPQANNVIKRMTRMTMQTYVKNIEREKAEELWESESRIVDLCFGADGTNKERLDYAKMLAEKIRTRIN